MNKFWNPSFETRPWAEVQCYWLEEVQNFIRTLQLKSEFYRERLRGFEASRLKDMKDLTEIPMVTKEELRKAQVAADRQSPLGAFQVAKTEDIIQVISSSGTTGRPVYYGVTERDLDMWRDALANFFYTAGIRREDVVGHLVGTPIFAGGEPYFEGLRRIGSMVVWAGGQSTVRIMETLRYLRCNAVVGTTSFDLYLGEHFPEVVSISARELGVRKVVGGGEPGLAEETIRSKIREVWGADTVREIMGLADVCPGMWAECEEESGMHFNAQKYVMVELVDPTTGEPLPWEPGVSGEAVYTTFKREATPVLRYRSGDHMRVEGVTCRCGRTSPRVRCIGRVDDMLIYKGMNVFPSAIRDVILSHFGTRLTGYLQIVKDHPQQVRFDTPIPVEVEVKSPGQDLTGLEAEIEAKVREFLNVRVKVYLVVPNTIERTVYKTPLVRVRHQN